MTRVRLRSIAISATLSACAASSAADQDAAQTQNDSPRHTITRPGDTCGVLRPGCPGVEDDGCPDVWVELANGCNHELTRELVTALVSEMKREPRFTGVVVRGDPQLCQCVASRIIAEGIEAARVVQQNDKRAYVDFEVDAWDGKACR